MQLRIEASDLPGRTCGPGYHNIHVGVQRRDRPDELLDLHPGDAPAAAWTLDCAAVPTAAGVDLKGPYVQGRPGGRFIYLSWVTMDDQGACTLFRRAKLMLDAIAPDTIDTARRSGRLVARLGLTDGKGHPVCAQVRPPLVDWSAAPSGGGVGEPDESGGDPYAGEVHCWWHLSGLSPELVAAVGDGWLPDGGLAVDLGCGLGTEVGYLADLGFQAVGVDLSMVALGRARRLHPRARFVAGDLLRLPVGDGLVDVVLDRGCFHYLAPADRGRYASAAWRALRPGGRLLLRACLRAHGIRNDLSAAVLRATFAGWREVSLREQPIPSDSRQMPALVARYERP